MNIQPERCIGRQEESSSPHRSINYLPLKFPIALQLTEKFVWPMLRGLAYQAVLRFVSSQFPTNLMDWLLIDSSSHHHTPIKPSWVMRDITTRLPRPFITRDRLEIGDLMFPPPQLGLLPTSSVACIGVRLFDRLSALLNRPLRWFVRIIGSSDFKRLVLLLW